MSYCRFSSDDFQCDVYVYEDCMGGWTTHVAGRRHVLKKPLPPPVDISDFKAWIRRDRKVRRILDRAKMVDIGLPHDGECFNDPTPGECADRLEELRVLGYRVPQYAIDQLRTEDKELEGKP
jgi:hypothetical protein